MPRATTIHLAGGRFQAHRGARVVMSWARAGKPLLHNGVHDDTLTREEVVGDIIVARDSLALCIRREVHERALKEIPDYVYLLKRAGSNRLLGHYREICCRTGPWMLGFYVHLGYLFDLFNLSVLANLCDRLKSLKSANKLTSILSFC